MMIYDYLPRLWLISKDIHSGDYIKSIDIPCNI